MTLFPILTRRHLIILTHDTVATAIAFVASFYVRFADAGLMERREWLIFIAPAFLSYALILFLLFRLHKVKWRFASLPDINNIVWVATLLAISLLILDYVLVSPKVLNEYFFGKLTIALFWLFEIFCLGGPRIAYRRFKQWHTQQHAKRQNAIPTIVIGRASDAEVLLRAIESGSVQKIAPVGILSPSSADQGQVLRGLPVLGYPADLERVVLEQQTQETKVARIVMTSTALDPGTHPEVVLMVARRLGISTSRLPTIEEERDAPRLAPIDVEDLLLRPSVKIDYEGLEAFVRGKAVVVTGGGGSIGAEICHRVVTFGASRLLVLENSELALHAILERLLLNNRDCEVEGRIADIRDRPRIFQLLSEFKPDLVFHAAALKHVPILERDWGEGVKTNVLGSINVADATLACKAAAMVMISTDKAIEPVSILGATKRFAEMYCQVLDIETAREAEGKSPSTRFIAVRFGNVLASNGSVVPKFKAQIEVGGPVTVTHPDMVRYFMTIREACDLVVTAASHALESKRVGVSVYVLNMGQPVKIVDLAERMIRLAGLEPNRDIDIVFTGIRPGERFNEILFAREEPSRDIGITGILGAQPICPTSEAMRAWLARLECGLNQEQRDIIYNVLRDAVPDFHGEAA